jgi:hypothetical protein
LTIWRRSLAHFFCELPARYARALADRKEIAAVLNAYPMSVGEAALRLFHCADAFVSILPSL